VRECLELMRDEAGRFSVRVAILRRPSTRDQIRILFQISARNDFQLLTFCAGRIDAPTAITFCKRHVMTAVCIISAAISEIMIHEFKVFPCEVDMDYSHSGLGLVT
jgi:hypothetical protein